MVPNHKGEIPVVVLLLPFLLGIVLGLNIFRGADTNWLTAIFVFISLLFIILNLNYSGLCLYKRRWLGGTLITPILFLFGLIIVIKYSELNVSNHFSKIPAQFLVVKINSEPNLKNGLLRVTAKVKESISKGKKTPTSGTLLITIKDSASKNLHYGDELIIPAKYNPVDPPLNPAEFNYKKYLADKNIYYQAFLYQKQFVLLKTNTGNPLVVRSFQLRQHFVEKIKRNMRDTGAIAVASTLILGYKADLSEDVFQAYAKTGTVYVLTVSGAQVAVIYLLLNYALSFLNRFKYGELIKAIAIITIISYYALLTGFSLAVCRVAFTVSMVIIGKTFARYVNTLNMLAISAFVLLWYDPFFITEVGFQLSYLAVSGLIVFQPVIYRWVSFKNKWADKLWAICSVSIAAQVIILPLSIFYFHEFPVYFLVSNLFVVIPAAVIMYTGILFLLLPTIPVVSASFAFILEKATIMMNKGLTFIEHLPFASISRLWISTPEYLLMFGIIISLFYFLLDKKIWLLKLSLFCALLLCLSFSAKSFNQSRSKTITWLNLKKHQAIIFKNGAQAIVLSDVKNGDKIYRYSVQPYLDSCGVGKVVLYSLNQDINTPWLKKRFDFIQFENTRVFIFNGGLQSNTLQKKLGVDYIYITGNPFVGLININSNFACQTFVIDGSNSDKSISGWEKEATAKHADYQILKRNKSFISVSK